MDGNTSAKLFFQLARQPEVVVVAVVVVGRGVVAHVAACAKTSFVISF